MINKFIAGTFLTAISMCVGLNIVPRDNYNKNLNNIMEMNRTIDDPYIIDSSKVFYAMTFGETKYLDYVVNESHGCLISAHALEDEISQLFLTSFEVNVIFKGNITGDQNKDEFLNKEKWLYVEFEFEYYISELANYVNSNTEFILLSDFTSPDIYGPTNITVNINNMLTYKQIESQFYAIDDIDGRLPVNISWHTSYYPNTRKIGMHKTFMYTEDFAGNYIEYPITINVVDTDNPTIGGKNSYIRNYDEPITIEEIKRNLVLSDNYDNNLVLEVVSDSYTGHERTLGNKYIKFKTKDSSNNVSNIFTVTVNVVDSKLPIISGPSEVEVSSSSPITLQTFKTKFTCSDDYDGTLSFDVSGFEQYTVDTTVCKTHVITLTGQDKSGNKVSKQVNLIVKDLLGPNVFIDDYFILLNQGVELTPEQIKEYASRAIGVSVDSIVEVSGEYDTNTPGNYKLAVKLITGETKSVTLSINAVKNYKERTMKCYEYLYKWFTIGFNIEGGYYHTDSFWSIFTRCKNFWELYTTGIYKELIE